MSGFLAAAGFFDLPSTLSVDLEGFEVDLAEVASLSSSDLVAVTAIYSEAVSTDLGSYELAAPDVPMMTRRWRNRIAKGYPHIVANSGDAVIGYAFARNARASAACDFIIEDGIYVASHAQGAGVGRALLEELLKICEALKFRQVIA
ncbi:MAG: GNAT family N-acetyltransferase, partial [Hymenobacter sp.]